MSCSLRPLLSKESQIGRRFCAPPYRPASEEVEEFNQENQNDCRFKKEGATLVKLLDHKVVQFFGSLELSLRQVLVVGDTDFGCGQLVEPGGKHIAEELDRVVGALGQFRYVEEH